MSAKFTKGPWAEHGKGGPSDLGDPMGPDCVPGRIAQLANTRLIAAAPDLYEALSALHAEADAGMIKGATLNLAANALTKARGEG